MGYIENIEAQMRKGILEFAILILIERKEIYSLDILKKLQSAKMIVVEGTLYPLLSRLKGHELVEYLWKESKTGPPRKYYRLTTHGKTALNELKQSWGALYGSINSLMQHHEKSN